MKTITFYSYKGGVGRSLALSNIAARLSELRKKVCVIDFDLEAPGLQFKFKNYKSSNNIVAGIVDYIYDFSCENILQKSISQYTYQLNPTNQNHSSIYFIPAGDIDSADYWRKLSKIRWSDLFYEKDSLGLGFFLDLKKKIENEIAPDFLLIDSRTGITDISGITLRVLADEAVVLSAYNEESLFGSKKIIKNLYNTKKSLFKKPLKVNFVLSRIPFSNDVKDREKEAFVKRKVQREFERYLNVDNFQVSIIHSDRRLEENEKHLIGYEYNENNISISNDYLKLFDILTKDALSEEEVNTLAKLKKAELEFKKAIKEDNVAKRIEYLMNTISLDPDNAEYYLELGQVNFDIGNYDKAIQYFEKSLSLTPSSYLYYAISVTYNRLNDIKEAIKYIEKAISLDKKNTEYKLQRYYLLYKAGEHKSALSVLNDILKNNPNDDRALNCRADLYRVLGNNDMAFTDVYKAIELNPSEPLYFGTLAEIFGTKGDKNGFYLNLSIALSRGLTAKELNSAKDVYLQFKEEARFQDLLEKSGLDIEEVFE